MITFGLDLFRVQTDSTYLRVVLGVVLGVVLRVNGSTFPKSVQFLVKFSLSQSSFSLQLTPPIIKSRKAKRIGTLSILVSVFDAKTTTMNRHNRISSFYTCPCVEFPYVLYCAQYSTYGYPYLEIGIPKLKKQQ